MTTKRVAEPRVSEPRARTAFRTVKVLVSTYLAISIATLAVAFALRNDTSVVTAAVWIRGSIVVASAALMVAFVSNAARGSRRAFLRLRIVSAVMLTAIVAIVSIPGTFPVWMKLEQAFCGLLLAAVVVIVNGRYLRSVFAPAE